MPSDIQKTHETPSAKRILSRFGHLLSAQGLEGVFSAPFFIYLAWLDSTLYGEVMYALAVGFVVTTAVQFGLYYPLVRDLGKAGKDKAPEIVNGVTIIKLALFLLTMFAVWGLAFFRGLSSQMAWILFLVCLGYAFDAMAETFFANLRVQGRQDKEARIKIASTVLGYGYGFLTAYMGFHPVLISMFMLVSGMVRLILGAGYYVRAFSVSPLMRPEWKAVWGMFRAAAVFALIENLGIFYNKTNIFFMERAVGVKGVAFYSATYSLVEPISGIASTQYLGWVIFPLLSTIWWDNREAAGDLVRTNAQWLLAIAFPIMLFLHAESELIIGIIYPEEYKDAVWMQQYLVWTILLSFELNLFTRVMMVAGATKTLLLFYALATIVNLILNIQLVQPFGLVGGCLVIVLTKLTMAILTISYCQIRFGFLKAGGFLFLFGLAGASLGVFLLTRPVITFHPAVAVTLAFYSLILWRRGIRFFGAPARREALKTGEE
ncbi:MAG: oligosaccharide flippase family protein [Deltaproteobacteria bacterium]|nr:oligosaccharide flippase family protein [Deltaproteobacteria bacterium]